MRTEITIGPPLLTINQGQTVLACEPDDQIARGGDNGLFFFDIRVVSVYELAADCAPFTLLNAAPVAYYASRSMLTNAEIATEDGPIPTGTLSVSLGRSVEGGRMRTSTTTAHAKRASNWRRDPQRLRRSVRGQVGRRHPPRLHSHGLGRKVDDAAHGLCQRHVPPRDRDPRGAGERRVSARQRPVDLRGRDRARPTLANLPPPYARRRRAALRSAGGMSCA